MPARTPSTPTSRWGCPPFRDYGLGAQILVDLGVSSMRLLTNNPAKRVGLDGYGLRRSPSEVPMPVRANAENLRYLRTKRDRMGHDLDGLEEAVSNGNAVPSGQHSTATGSPA